MQSATALPATSRPEKSTRRERLAWYLYDFGNSAYASVVLLAVYAAYFQGTVVGGAEGTRLWGRSIAIAMIIVAVISPFLGVIADFTANKKRFLFGFTVLSVGFTGLLFFVQKGDIVTGMLFFILSEIGYRSSQVFYDAMLPDIAEPEEMGSISGIGWAVGSAGGVVCLLIVLPLIVLFPGELMVRISMIITALFFALAAIPLFLWLPERGSQRKLPVGENLLSMAVRQLSATLRAGRNFKEFMKFMLSFLVFNDGVIMALNFAAIIGARLFGMEQQMLIVFVIIVNVTNVFGAYIFGKATDRLGGKGSLNLSILVMIAVVAWMYFAQSQTEFLIAGAVAGIAMAGMQSVSRTMVALLTPASQSAEFYGFFAVTGRASSFVGPAVFGWVAAESALMFEAQGMTALAAEQAGLRLGLVSIAVFLVIGLGLLGFVNEKNAAKERKNSSQIA